MIVSAWITKAHEQKFGIHNERNRYEKQNEPKKFGSGISTTQKTKKLSSINRSC